MEHTHIATIVMQELSTCKYFYKSQIEGAVAAICHRRRLDVSKEEQAKIVDMVTEGFKTLGY